ncbi:MAG: DUF2800 domain-containing protein [Selenomonadaceae bacterium]|nr:DUF2800 domain-containing protein [Selenomonadaceae bacterium]
MKHALLAPSAAHRWLNCTPSARLEESFPESESTAAAEGTFAHHFAEVTLQNFLHNKNEKCEENSYYSKSLEEYVSVYTDCVIEKYVQAKNQDESAECLIEHKFSLTDFVPASFGHADAVILSNGSLEIIDLKYGKGVPVKAQNNSQLRLYALGVYAEMSFLYDIKTVTVTIVQPRNGGISSETMTIEELLNWGEKIKPIAQTAFKGEGEFKAGRHCQFCRAANLCRALANYNLEKVKADFDNPDLLNDDEIAEILTRADDTIKWLNSIKEYALSESLKNGKRWTGFKIVEGRSVRKIVDAEKAAEILKANGGEDSEIWKPKELLGLTALEKNFGKKKLSEMLAEVIQKPNGAPTLVSESDPRPEWNNVKNDFDEEN